MKKWNPKDIESIVAYKSELFEDLKTESNDYSCVLLGVSYLDELFASLLKKRFIDGSTTVSKILNPSGGILGTFISRIDISYCLGLINKELKNDCQVIGEIRNIFAHNLLKTTFESDAIQLKCDELKYYKTVFSDEDNSIKDKYSSDELAIIAKNKFILSLVLITSSLEVDTMSRK